LVGTPGAPDASPGAVAGPLQWNHDSEPVNYRMDPEFDSARSTEIEGYRLLRWVAVKTRDRRDPPPGSMRQETRTAAGAGAGPRNADGFGRPSEGYSDPSGPAGFRNLMGRTQEEENARLKSVNLMNPDVGRVRPDA